MKAKTAEEIIAASREYRKRSGMSPLLYAVNPNRNAIATRHPLAPKEDWHISAALLITGEWVECGMRIMADGAEVFTDWQEIEI